MPDLSAIKKSLTARLEELQTSTEATAESRKPVELDQAAVGRLSRMDALQVQAMAQATERHREQEIARIKAALDRIEADEFGYCIVCGEEIAPKRLEIDPTVPTCIVCASGK
ncbi:MAG: molecular chaperone DnaK [Rhodospirillaceae bacterium]|nr:molecular chaperone DnaK [Rhodospirillaceae bacterium]|tara:strand:- start:498 stop:833 length:336 start_codon:yes stop_codon:yes gene_type:complete